METRSSDIYGFYDGDFTFHTVEYDRDPALDFAFRVRFDCEDPEQRAGENEGNPNGAPPGWDRVRPATAEEIASWFRLFRGRFPTRPERHTGALRLLCLSGLRHSGLRNVQEVSVKVPLLELTFPILRVRDFKGAYVRFVEMKDDTFCLTEEGRWLTGLMK